MSVYLNRVVKDVALGSVVAAVREFLWASASALVSRSASASG
jgi:hypothetical protein